MAATPQILALAISAFLGQPDYTHTTLLEYVSPETLQGAEVFQTALNLPAGGAVQTANLPVLFPLATNVQFVAVFDITNPGQPFIIDTFANVPVAAGAFLAWQQNGGVPPSMQFHNPSATVAGQIQIVVVSL